MARIRFLCVIQATLLLGTIYVLCCAEYYFSLLSREEPIPCSHCGFLPTTLETHNTSLELTPNNSGDPWTGNAAYHNQTVQGTELPGLYWNDQLLLLGARLTVDGGIHATVFGMPGDFWQRRKQGEIRCPANSWYGPNGTVLSHRGIQRRMRLYVSLGDEVDMLPQSDVLDDDRRVAMELIPTVSADSNQNNVTLIWHANLESLGISLDGEAVRIQVWAGPAITYGPRFQSIQSLFTADIPLSTGVIGQAGPQIVGSSSIMNRPTMDASVCVGVYGSKALQFLPEFILHHEAVGFGQVVVGILDGSVGSPEMERAGEYLADFVESGVVSLAAMDLPLDCEVNIRKVHFYNSCLYHSKGMSKYMAILDVDEYWIPPKRDGGNGGYSDYLTVGEAMAQVQAYQASAGCGNEWCYHAFPSWKVWLRRTVQENKWDDRWQRRQGVICQDFERRDDRIDWEWSKSLVRTDVAFSAGIHQIGSCRFPNASSYSSRDESIWHPELGSHCWNLRRTGFGSIDHFYSLHRPRQEGPLFRDHCGVSPSETNCTKDVYVHEFCETIQQQLAIREQEIGDGRSE